MDHKDITIFLELVRCRNISKTAENLYLSQSAVSSRLKALEEEMGCQLVLRSKGQRSVELTRQGEEFISVAERWKLLLEETEAVKEKALSVVRIATNGSTYDRLLDEFLRQYTERHPEKKIQIKVCDSKDTYDLVSKELGNWRISVSRPMSPYREAWLSGVSIGSPCVSSAVRSHRSRRIPSAPVSWIRSGRSALSAAISTV